MSKRMAGGATMTPPAMSLEDLVGSVSYKPGWKFRLGGPGNRFVCVFATTPDSRDPSVERTTQHMFEPPADCDDLVRWLFERLLDAERHETGEFYKINGSAPFFPYHQNEGDPYTFVDRREQTP